MLMRCCWALVFVMIAWPAWAGEDQRWMRLAPVWWQYEESAGAVPGYLNTPFSSRARGWAALLEAGARDALIPGSSLGIEAEARGLMGLNRPVERWNLPAAVQTDRIELAGARARLGLDWRRALGAGVIAVGLDAGYRWHRQTRSRFALTGRPVAQTPVREWIQSAWWMPRLDWRGGSGAASIWAGRPFWVRARNEQVGVFRNRRGWLIGARAEFRLRRGEAIAWRLFAEIEQVQLGRDSRTYGYWPDNRFRMFALGAMGRW